MPTGQRTIFNSITGMTIKTPTPSIVKAVASPIEDYATILRLHNLKYTEADNFYYQVGTLKKTQGWILHLSVIKTQVSELLNQVLPLLQAEKTAFKILKNPTLVKQSLDGTLGQPYHAKIMRLYPESDTQALALAKKLTSLTQHLKGPAISTDAPLKGILYTRYGAHNPVIKTNKAGQQEPFIYDDQQQLIRDTYYIPFKKPTHIPWPFDEISAPPTPGGSKYMKGNYLITGTLKRDPKGDVFKAIQVTHYYPERCLIKEGKHDMWSDDYGRDIQERLRWQYKLQQQLANTVNVPKAYSLFEERGNTYLAMQYIKGQSLNEKLASICKRRSWLTLSGNEKVSILNYLLQIVIQVGKLHALGLVHRDITPVNFLVNKKNELFMIDLELAYSLQEETPYPPFRLGTPGFMSPEQRKTLTPTVKEDIHNLGGTMIMLFTTLHPVKFSTHNLLLLKENMQFFTGDEAIANLITQCMQPNPHDRPDLNTIKEGVMQFREARRHPSHQPITKPSGPPAEALKEVITESLETIVQKMTKQTATTAYDEEDTPVPPSDLDTGFSNGLAGMLYVLAQAKQAGLQVNGMGSAYQHWHAMAVRHVTNPKVVMPAGLYTGIAGLAMATAAGLQAGLINNPAKKLVPLQGCFETNVEDVNIANGVAGTGLSLLPCIPYLNEKQTNTWLNAYVNSLIQKQQKDGAWSSPTNTSIKHTGLLYGNAGIALFLMACYRHTKQKSLEGAIQKSLQWLCQQAVKKSGKKTWYVTNKHKMIEHGVAEGTAGVALCFMHAYELFGDPNFRTQAEEALSHIPQQVLIDNLTFYNGLSGWGEVYLEAYRVFKSDAWKGRADWIASTLLHTSHQNDQGKRYWYANSAFPPTFGFMQGTGGILHFLIRYYSAGQLAFSMLPRA